MASIAALHTSPCWRNPSIRRRSDRFSPASRGRQYGRPASGLPCSSGYRPVAPLLRRQYHHHLAAFQARELLDLGADVHLFLDAVEHLDAEFLVHHLAAAEAERHLHLVAFLEEAGDGAHLDLEVVVVDAGPELDLL